MNQGSLTARFRPQKFAEVVGQEVVKTVLARASLEDAVAPAYLFSGTRGVGKTTIARIFAKALNCETAPTAEPCGVCRWCRAITAGAAVDVIEIDGASNRGIDDARRIKEDATFAPMELRWKVFIIDEAHMLTKEAFNALLKTLEEPPKRTTFILATTEAHKFPATILSRCQHFLFKRQSDARLVEHLTSVMTREGLSFEPEALTLIARRGQGSVRDSMSLLGQAIALGGASLTVQSAREVLGLADEELFSQTLDAIAAKDPVRVVQVVGSVLDQGLDLGFFLSELGALWRNLFLVSQSGEAALSVIEAGEDYKTRLVEQAGRFHASHIHAAWQATLEGRRRVLTGQEPALSLELLLLNLAYLPVLLGLESVGGLGGSAAPGSSAPNAPSASGASGGAAGAGRSVPTRGFAEEAPERRTPTTPAPAERPAEQFADAAVRNPAAPIAGPRNWAGFLEFLATDPRGGGLPVNEFRRMSTGRLDANGLTLTNVQPFLLSKAKEYGPRLEAAAKAYWGPETAVVWDAPEPTDRAETPRPEEHPTVKRVMDAMQAKIIPQAPERRF